LLFYRTPFRRFYAQHLAPLLKRLLRIQPKPISRRLLRTAPFPRIFQDSPFHVGQNFVYSPAWPNRRIDATDGLFKTQRR
jgi:hypothetical protein